VVAPTAVAAGTLSTAARAMGSASGLNLLTREGVEGLLILTDGGCIATHGPRHLVPSIGWIVTLHGPQRGRRLQTAGPD